MATLASRSKLLSGLPSGTLAQHLAAISLGTGERLVSQFFVSIQPPEIHVTQKAKRKAEKPVQQPSASRTVKTKKNLFVTTAIPQLYVTQSIDEIYGVQKTNTTQITTRLETATISTKRK